MQVLGVVHFQSCWITGTHVGKKKCGAKLGGLFFFILKSCMAQC